MNKTLVALLCGASVVGVSAGSAFAGEWAPGSGTTPIKEHVANSVCSFNGADEPDATEEHLPPGPRSDDGYWATTPAGGRVQSGGQGVAAMASSASGALAGGLAGGFSADCKGGGDHD
jgi:hypothetical protein